VKARATSSARPPRRRIDRNISSTRFRRPGTNVLLTSPLKPTGADGTTWSVNKDRRGRQRLVDAIQRAQSSIHIASGTYGCDPSPRR